MKPNLTGPLKIKIYTFSRMIGSVLGLLILSNICIAQQVGPSSQLPIPTPTPTKVDLSQAPLTDRERAMLELITTLQDRVTKLESAQPTSAAQTATPDKVAGTPAAAAPTKNVETDDNAKPADADIAQQKDDSDGWGEYTPNVGFKIADTKYGDMSVSIY